MSRTATSQEPFKGVCQIGIATAQPEKIISFYRDLLGFPVLFESNGMTFMQAGATSLVIAAVADAKTPSGDVIIYFEPSDWGAAEGALEAVGVMFDHAAIVVQRDGAREHALRPFRDPEGRPVYLLGWRPAA